jgi:hypothetical protein
VRPVECGDGVLLFFIVDLYKTAAIEVDDLGEPFRIIGPEAIVLEVVRCDGRLESIS